MGPRAREVGGKEQRYVVVYAPTTACTGRPSAGPHAARRSSVGNHFTPNHFLRRSRNLLPDRPAGYIRGLAQTFFTTFLSSLISQFFFILASSVTLSAASTFPASALVQPARLTRPGNVLLLFYIFSRFTADQLSQHLPDRSSPRMCKVGKTTAVSDRCEITYRSFNGPCRDNLFSLALSTELSSGDIR